eukprot:288994-Prymnesium_polylepis.1
MLPPQLRVHQPEVRARHVVEEPRQRTVGGLLLLILELRHERLAVIRGDAQSSAPRRPAGSAKDAPHEGLRHLRRRTQKDETPSTPSPTAAGFASCRSGTGGVNNSVLVGQEMRA